jgi:Tol biopolymer transport system component
MARYSPLDSAGGLATRRMSTRLTLAAVIAVAAVACAAALATTPGSNGQIAFRRYLNRAQTKSAIFTMNADGSNVRRVTHAPRAMHDDGPDWSPDGKRLAFTRIPDNGPNLVEVVNADGSGLQRVTPRCAHKPTPNGVPRGCEDAGEVSFTPDGQHVTYVRATGHVRHFKKFNYDQIEHAAVAIIGVDGSGEREILRLPRYSADVHYPQVSPDGRLIVFERFNSPLSRPRFGLALFVMNADGTGVHRVTPWNLHAGDNPDWAPDSSRVLFRSNVDVNDERSQYYTVRPDGTGLTQLTHFPFTHRRLFSATFSPDGSQIVFGKADGTGSGDIWIMNADGSNPHLVLLAKPWDSAPDWGSAG